MRGAERGLGRAVLSPESRNFFAGWHPPMDCHVYGPTCVSASIGQALRHPEGTRPARDADGLIALIGHASAAIKQWCWRVGAYRIRPYRLSNDRLSTIETVRCCTLNPQEM